MVYFNDFNNFKVRPHKDVYSHTRHLTPVPLPHGHVKLIDTPAGSAGVTGGGGAEPGQPLEHVMHGPVHRVPLTLVTSSGMSPDTLPQLWQHSEISHIGNISSISVLYYFKFCCMEPCLMRHNKTYINCLNTAIKKW